jgi:hypothetical protein
MRVGNLRRAKKISDRAAGRISPPAIAEVDDRIRAGWAIGYAIGSNGDGCGSVQANDGVKFSAVAKMTSTGSEYLRAAPILCLVH